MSLAGFEPDVGALRGRYPEPTRRQGQELVTDRILTGAYCFSKVAPELL